MPFTRRDLYRFPWSQTDNPGSWIEVTDRCNMVCRGCYRHKVEGDRALEDVKADIEANHRLTNCDSITIAGGEPLLYPHLADVVHDIHRRGIKPVVLTNGIGFTRGVASDLKRAGLARIHFHVDSGQIRPGWEGKNERELNHLRQQYADLCWELGGFQCGFNSTIYRSTMEYLPAIVEWTRKNIEKVQHYSLIAYRAIPLNNGYEYSVSGKPIDSSLIPNTVSELTEISISSREMYDVLSPHFAGFQPSSYLNGSSILETDKYLIVVLAGSRHEIYGSLGAKTVELVQVFYHLAKGRYCAFLRSPKAGKKLFVMSLVDPEVRQTLRRYVRSVLRNPLRVFDSIYVQSIHFQQPYEIVGGEINLCEDCANKMAYDGMLISSCRLDEYRMLGGLLTPRPVNSHRQESTVTVGGAGT